MQKKNKAVVFEDGYATVYISTGELHFIEGSGVYVNPDLSAVKGVPPELWEERDGRIMPITDLAKVSERMSVASDEVQSVDWRRDIAELESKLGAMITKVEYEARERRLDVAYLRESVRALSDENRVNNISKANRFLGIDDELKKLRRLAVIGLTALMFLCLILKLI